jgi:carboxyl-terminal processing protease
MLYKTLGLIDKRYYEDPNYRKAASGALDNLLRVCESKSLYEFLDGLANPMLRNHFVRKLTALRRDVQRADDFDHHDLRRLFNQVADVNRLSIDVPEGLLIVEFLEGIHIELDDYTHVIWPADMKDFRKLLMGDFEGIGIQLGIDERSNRLKVVTPLESSPALRAGIQPDDLIIAVDGESTKGWSTQDAVENIMGPSGSKVKLSIQRPKTGQILEFTLTRSQIILTTVRGAKRIPGTSDSWDYMLDEDAGIAYIRLTDFHPDSAIEFSEALSDARRQGMKALVLDLRHNSGGVLDVAIDIASNFLSRDEVVSTRGRVERETQRARGNGVYTELPLVVLVNSGSASASEILSGALQDHNRAIVLGGRTYGKGVVQHVLPLGQDAQLKVTIAHYYLPSGRSPQKMPDSDEWGVEPDFSLELTPKEFRRVLERERDSYVIHNEQKGDQRILSEEEQEELLSSIKGDLGEDEDDLLTEAQVEWLSSDPHEAPKADPQLETALLLLRVKLAANAPWPRHFAAAKPPEKKR